MKTQSEMIFDLQLVKDGQPFACLKCKNDRFISRRHFFACQKCHAVYVGKFVVATGEVAA